MPFESQSLIVGGQFLLGGTSQIVYICILEIELRLYKFDQQNIFVRTSTEVLLKWV
jgi:hypothetical protein